MKILGISRDDRACNLYRILTPLSKIKQHGLADCSLIDYGADISSEECYRRVLESDVVLIPRPHSEEWLNFVNAVRRAGKLVVSDYDDDPFNVSPYNPYYRFSGLKEFEVVWPDGHREWLWKDGMTGPKGEKFFDIEANIHRRDMCRASFAKSDIVTCTVEPLQKEFLKVNKNTLILPNLLDFSLFPKCDLMPNKKFKVGWQGGVSHFEDLELLLPIITKFGSQHDVEFSYFGDHRLGSLFKNVSGFKHEMFVPTDVYPYKLKLLNFDVGIAPLVDNHFNRCKSAIKYFEYSACGVPTIASNVQPYSDVITNMVDGILVNDEREWIEALEMLMYDEDLRFKLARNAYDNVYENYNADKFAFKWVNAYEEALMKDKLLV